MQSAPRAVRGFLDKIGKRYDRLIGRPRWTDLMEKYALDPAKRDEIAASLPQGDVAKMFFGHTGRPINKWVHYPEIYDRHFAPYRRPDVKMLEIGIFKGGSLQMWRKYFGPQATIFGIDIDPACADRVSAPNQARIGSQDDEEFLRRVVAEMGTPDIILDDGSHRGDHQWASFKILFPLLKSGGIYVIEDLHTSYWPGSHDGAYGAARTGIGLVKQIIDDVHSWYHREPTRTPAKTWVSGIHVYDSIVVIEKNQRGQPGNIETVEELE